MHDYRKEVFPDPVVNDGLDVHPFFDSDFLYKRGDIGIKINGDIKLSSGTVKFATLSA